MRRLGAFLWAAGARTKLFRVDLGQLPERIVLHAPYRSRASAHSTRCMSDLSVIYLCILSNPQHRVQTTSSHQQKS